MCRKSWLPCPGSKQLSKISCNMLDFNKLVEQIKDVGSDSLKEPSEESSLGAAMSVLEEASCDPGAFDERMLDAAELVLWPVARTLEPFGSTYPTAEPPAGHTVVAVDGSQIMPSHHEVHSCYLLNVGLALVSYGVKQAPRLESFPRLHHRPEDLYPLVDRRRMHIDELFVSLERTVYELEILSYHSILAGERGLPVVACFDGSLIPWSVEKMAPSYQDRFLDRFVNLIRQFSVNGIPLLGYVSHSRSSDAVNMLRTFACPFDLPDCRSYCGHLNEEDFPCSRLWPLTDRALFQTKLNKFERSNLFFSGARMSTLLPRDVQVGFTYLNTGAEVARLEFPAYVTERRELLDLALAAIRAQAVKGHGYPVALAEAHNLAVVRAKDRERFFELMARHLVDIGVKGVRTSPKERNKRMGFV